MDARKENLLLKIITEHIKTAQPVGSNLLVNKYFDLSSATVRNEMVELEKEGFLKQPHTSAGRIPTEAGYRYYLNNFLKSKELTANQKKNLDKVKQLSREYTQLIKNMAKTTADLSGNTVFVAFTSNDVYYTGLTNLFSQPEFENIDLIRNMSQIIDHLDEMIKDLFFQTKDKTEILIGSDNPFARECSTVVANYGQGILGILGPLRMNYEQNIALINYVKKLINN